MSKIKFDFSIGNPPYAKDNSISGRGLPLYNKFMDSSYAVSDFVELVTPARFLFNAGLTPVWWNRQVISSKTFKVLSYYPDSSLVFKGTDIKGGVAIHINNNTGEYEPVNVFTPHKELNSIVNTVNNIRGNLPALDTVVSFRGNYKFTDKLRRDFPAEVSKLSKKTENMIASNFFEKLRSVFKYNGNPESCYKFMCRMDNKRTVVDVEKEYIQENPFLDTYNVAVPKSSGSGTFGESLTSLDILPPGMGASDTFISIGLFNTEEEVLSLEKYLKTKFLRALLGVNKVTQDNSRRVWNLIPIQDFTLNSDIDWTKSIPGIDKQLYKKYNLTPEEIEFIEKNVKTMK